MRLTQRKRRDCHSQQSLHVPNACTPLRVILDRAVKGLPVNARVSEHVPLPPDGMDMDDFERGTDEILDLVDAQNVSERVEAYNEEQKKKQEEEKKRKEEEALNAKIEEEIARRAQLQS